jgi:REP element-mobilizing transposase RayT
MGRKRREEREGAVVHVWARGNNQRALFADDEDRLRYLEILGGVVEEANWRCLAYCLMTNHVHLLVETPDANLAWGMWRAHGSYARSFNRRHGRKNHLFGARYGPRDITDGEHLWFAAAYVLLNPVRAGLCADPEDWRWSSYRAMVGLEAAPRWLHIARLLSRCGEGGGADAEAFFTQLRMVRSVWDVQNAVAMPA